MIHRFLAACCLLILPVLLKAAEPAAGDIKILNGEPTRIYFTGNPHHPVFGKEKLAALLDRHFAGKSPVQVDGLPDARKDPVTGKPIPPAKTNELIRFLKPEFAAKRPPGERLIVLTYAIVEEPRTKPPADWVKQGADDLEAYGKDALADGAKRVFVSEMVQPSHISGGAAGNKFRRAGLKVLDALEQRKLPGIVRGPHFQELMENQKHFFRDDRHYSDAGKDYMGCLWFEALLTHDGLAAPPWLRQEIEALVKAGKP